MQVTTYIEWVGIMRNSKTIGILFVAMFLLPLAVSAYSSERNDQIEPLYDVDIWVETRGYNYFGYYCVEGTFLYVEFEVVSGGDVDFFIFNEANYEDWIDDFDATSIYHYPNCESYEYNLTIEYTDYFYIVFANFDYSTSKHVVGTILRPGSTTATPSDVDTAVIMGAVLVAGIGLVLIFALIIWKSRKKQAGKSVRFDSPSLQTTGDHSTQQRPAVRCSHCRYCGASNTGIPLHATHCPSCGGDLGEPPSTM